MRAVETDITPLIPTCPDCRPVIPVNPFYPARVAYNDKVFVYNGVIFTYNDIDAQSRAVMSEITKVKPSPCHPCKTTEEGVGITPVNSVPPIIPVDNTDASAGLRTAISSVMHVLPSAPERESPSCPERKDVPEIAPDNCYMGINDFLALAHAAKGKSVSVWDFVKIAEYLFGNFFLSLDVFCERGSTMLGRDSSADLQAVLKLGYEDVTDRIPPQYFSWERSSKNENQDRIWNLRHQGVGSRIHVTRSDVNRACTFYCLIPITCLTTINQ